MTAAQISAPQLLIGHGARCAGHSVPHKLALYDTSGTQRTFGQLTDRMRRLGILARDHFCLEKGVRAALIAPNCIDYAEVVMGLADAGITVVTVNPESTIPELEYIFANSDTQLVMTHPGCLDKVQASVTADIKLLELGESLEDALAKVNDCEAYIDADAEDIFCISYTSGTTGKPKGVQLSHRGRSTMFMLALAGSYGTHTPDIHALAVSPFFNGGGLAHLLGPLFFGGTVGIAGKFSADTALRLLQNHITFAALAPTQLTAMLETGSWGNLPALRALVTNSSASSKALKERLIDQVGEGRLYDSYGSTESGVTAILHPADLMHKAGSIGRPVPGARMGVFDIGNRQVKPGESGELACQVPWLFSGYLNDPLASESVLRDGWYATGDLAYVDADGFFHIVGRKKQVIITGGQNVFPLEVENAILEHPSISEVAVVGVPDDYWGEAVTAAYNTRPGTAAEPEENLRNFVKAKLTGYKVPKRFIKMDDLPKNGTGKIQHSEILQRIIRQNQTEQKR